MIKVIKNKSKVDSIRDTIQKKLTEVKSDANKMGVMDRVFNVLDVSVIFFHYTEVTNVITM